ncbi:DUF3467 domain-containing protein [bacterium]|nr:DUF3467 domain-containing protein [bacterium]
MEQRAQQQIKIELGDQEAEGIYANLALITHSPTELIIDFARVMPGSPKTRVLSRIIMTPMHAKLLQKALTDNIGKFEKQFGEIKIHGGPSANQNPIGFGAQDTSDGKA